MSVSFSEGIRLFGMAIIKRMLYDYPCDICVILLMLSFHHQMKKEKAEMKERENRKDLNEGELEEVSGGRIPIFNPGETGCPIDPKTDEPHDGGATGSW